MNEEYLFADNSGKVAKLKEIGQHYFCCFINIDPSYFGQKPEDYIERWIQRSTTFKLS